MVRLSSYDNLDELINELEMNRIYPLSIAEDFQKGEIFTNNAENPNAVMFWHYCGFAYIAGRYDEQFINEILDMMRHPTENHRNRLVLHTNNDDSLSQLILKNNDIKLKKRYCFEFPEKNPVPILEAPFRLVRIDEENYDLLCGNITPSFSWDSKENFLKNGFGWCILNDRKFAACAFSASVSEEYVDIGVETAADYRGMGLGKIVSTAMIDEILKLGKKPLWECNCENEASKRLALSVGFKIISTHPMYTL